MSLNCELAVQSLVGFLREETRKFGFEKLVIGLSGGIDSALTSALATEALGPENVIPIAMPHATSVPSSLADARLVAEHLGLDLRVVDITASTDAMAAQLDCEDALRLGNIKARMRMIVLYDCSAKESALVAGTSNKTEMLLGYSTQHGDSASGINPIGDLYKCQVFELSEAMGLPRSVIDKAPSADLWEGQTDEQEMGFRYAELDRLLVKIVDHRATDAQLERAGFDLSFVQELRRRVRNAQYKRQPPILAKVGMRTIGMDFLYHRDWGR
ncbi:MAG: NAD(+) synthetase [Planctomycetota bacterium]|nr:MAG: NAD(+) synthetase [Planctomycetota bacterium]